MMTIWAMRWTRVVGFLVFLFVSQSAAAQWSSRFVNRPLTMPRSTLRLDTAFALVSINPPMGVRDNFFSGSFGAGVGVLRDFELGAVLIPQRLAPSFEFGNPSFYGTYRLLRGDFEVGLRGDVYIAAGDRIDFTHGAHIPLIPLLGDVAFGVPMRAHIANILRLDTGIHFGLQLSDPTIARLTIPLNLAIQVSSRVYLGPQFGIVVNDFEDTDVPLGFFLGGTLGPTRRPVVDLTGTVSMPDVDQGFDVFIIGAAANFYLYL